jgi:peptide deformylase
VPGLHGQVPRHTHIGIRFQTPAGRTVEEEVKGPVAALLEHECDHLDGVLYPMRIQDMSTLSFNTDPGRLAADAARKADIDPILRALVDNWADRQRWLAAR